MRALCLLAAALFLVQPASARINSTDLSQWLPELPPFSRVPEGNRPRHIREWLRHVRPGMSVTQVVTLLGYPDWGVNKRGKLRWAVDPRDGVLQYSNDPGERDGGGRLIRIHFDPEARVKLIVDNGVVIGRAPRALLPDPLPRGVWWRR